MFVYFFSIVAAFLTLWRAVRYSLHLNLLVQENHWIVFVHYPYFTYLFFLNVNFFINLFPKLQQTGTLSLARRGDKDIHLF